MSIDASAFIGYGYIVKKEDFPETIIVNGEENDTRDYIRDISNDYGTYGDIINQYDKNSPYFVGIILRSTENYESFNPFIVFLNKEEQEVFFRLGNELKNHMPQVIENQVPELYLVQSFY